MSVWVPLEGLGECVSSGAFASGWVLSAVNLVAIFVCVFVVYGQVVCRCQVTASLCVITARVTGVVVQACVAECSMWDWCCLTEEVCVGHLRVFRRFHVCVTSVVVSRSPS